MEALDISFGSRDVTPGWCTARRNDGFQLLICDLWTGSSQFPDAERALGMWREAGGLIAGYFVVHDGRPVAEHIANAKASAGVEWSNLSFVSIDCEVVAVTPQDVLDAAVAIAADGLRPVVYTGSGFWREHVDNSRDCANLPLWNASYPSDPNRAFPASLGSPAYGGWTACVGHQRQRTHAIDGIDVDLSTFDDLWIGEPGHDDGDRPTAADIQNAINVVAGWGTQLTISSSAAEFAQAAKECADAASTFAQASRTRRRP
jgi:hypothetical protein